MPLPIGVPAAAGKIITKATPQLAEWVFTKTVSYMGKPQGSQVKQGAYKDCTIDRGDVVFLTSDTIQSCQLLKEKKKLHSGKLKTYYYYNIFFKDGSRSYVRMRKKYRNAMLNHM